MVNSSIPKQLWQLAVLFDRDMAGGKRTGSWIILEYKDDASQLGPSFAAADGVVCGFGDRGGRD
jgi:hypothetical protein